MGEQDALIFLANVALHNERVPAPIYHKKKETRPKELKIIHMNGLNIAEINDLRSLPMSAIFKIFIEKFVDTTRRCTVYVCKFGLRNGCNTKFMDAKENRINRLEHLIQCHLLEHLIKTKSGSFIEIPKKSLKNMKTNTSSKFETDNSKNNRTDFSRNEQNAVKNFDHSTPMNREHLTGKSIPPNNDKDQTMIDVAKIDHTYAVTDEKKSINSTNSSEEYQLIRSNNVRIDELFSPNGECSQELSSFMMYETLHQPTNIFIIDGADLIVEKLPIVGAEVEVATSCDRSVPNNLTPSADKIHYTCSLCTCSYVTKKSLNMHVRKKHTDSQELKTTKRKIISNEEELVTCDSKATKMIHTSQTSENDNKDWFADVKENLKVNVDFTDKNDSSILKTALTKSQTEKRPIINISNVWNNIHVQYV